jgi:ribulose-phosphate 3-epimerase
MQTKIAPSILSADFSVMGEAIKKLEKSGADLVHCDVMDGTFVEPITFGGQMIKNIRGLTKLPLDCHLMIEHPKTQIKFFCRGGCGHHNSALQGLPKNFTHIFRRNFKPH